MPSEIKVDDVKGLIQELKSKGSGEKGIKIIGDLFYKFSETKGLEGVDLHERLRLGHSKEHGQ